MIDLRSDTVTRPGDEMRQYMSKADVGDDVFSDDPSVNRMEDRVAELLGQESALLCPSGTQSNLVGLLTHCGRGEEYIVGQSYHTYLYEAGGAACLGGIQPQPINVDENGTIPLNSVRKLIKPDDYHFVKTRLLCLENTHSGKVISQSYLSEAIILAHSKRLSIHLDGARVFNAAVAQGIAINEITQGFDSVSVCFSKGLGAPIGSVLVGNRDFIQSARRWRKMVGGGMRQAGIVAAGIEYALNHNVARLQLDHEHAKLLEEGLRQISEIEVHSANTNILYIEFSSQREALRVSRVLAEKNIHIVPEKKCRLVTHLDIDDSQVRIAISAMKLAFSQKFSE